MKGFAIALLLIAAASSVRSLEFGELMKKQPCLVQNDLGITGNIGEDYKYDYDSVPDSMMWNNVNGTNFLTVVKNQHLPQYCGSCWAQCVASSLSDRIKIMRKGAWPDVNIAPQVLVSCSMADNGCHGGDLITAFKYGNENELTDETCAIYKGRGHDNGNACSPVTMCRDCGQHKPCFIPSQYHVYKVDKYGTIKGEKDMMAEIAKNGPIACAIDATDELFYNYTGGIFEDKTGAQSLNHGISVVGYGEENGVKFWHVRNSWGDTWGEKGFFRVVRGKNNIGIESYCSFGIPLDTWTTPLMHNTTQAERDDPRNDYTNGPYPGEKPVSELLNNEVQGCYIKGEFTEDQKNFVPEKLKNLKVEDLPTSVDWRNFNGTNYLSYTKNQHIPIYCGSCWAQGSTAALADRFNIFNWLTKKQPQIPQTSLSAQVIVNCEAGGSCNGGFHGSVYEYARTKGIPHDSCMQYIAHNIDKRSEVCTDFHICRDCIGPAPAKNETGFDKCWAVKNYNRHYSSKTRSFSGANNMKAELAAYGPISCGIAATSKFQQYKGGIYSETNSGWINHIISVVGYGKDEETGQEYWIGRNSWGTYWGEHGFFRIKMYKDNNAIEQDCAAGYPTDQKAEDVMTITE